MTEVQKRENEMEEDLEMTMEEKIEHLERRIEELQKVINANLEEAHNAKVLDVEKIKEALNTGSDYVMNAVKPVMEKCQTSGKEAVAKVETKVSENPLISLMTAFGIGIALGTAVNYIVKSSERKD
ncbi:MAG: hypothetical protein RR272_02540 [Synergistaceae bacterium]